MYGIEIVKSRHKKLLTDEQYFIILTVGILRRIDGST